MIPLQRSPISSYVTDLLSAGRVVFSREEAESTLGISRGAFLDAAEGLQRKRYLIRPRQGFYVVVPPYYSFWGAPPAGWYIDDLMRHEGHPYYVGLLKAAELHGAAHQAVLEFQVITDKRMQRIRAGRSIIAFYYRKEMKTIESGVENRKTDTGRMRISSVELTALDLVRYPHAVGGLDNIATVLSELAGKIDPDKLGALAQSFERSVGQRLGYLLSRVGHEDRTIALHEHLHRGSSLRWIELDPTEPSDSDFALEPKERDERWRVVVRHLPEVDI
jgi:predicted transcriptional regulator of viral defense system